MHVVDDVILAAWICFWAYWLVCSFNVKTARTRSSGGIAIRVALVLVLLSLVRGRVIKGHAATVSNPVLQGIGLAVFFSGLALAVWARLYLGRNWGTPMSQKVDPELVTTGPYRFVRHPIYSGIILAMVGTTIAVSWYWLAGVVLLGAYFTYSSIIEERNLSALFPATFPDYKRSTKRMIPLIF